MNRAEKIRDIIRSSFFTDEEVNSGMTKDAILVDGVTTKFGFHPARIQERKEDILRILRDVVSDDFIEGKGDGSSFMTLVIDKDGNHWGEHSDVQSLVCLAIAAGYAKYTLPRAMWGMLPGAMPYITFMGIE